MAQIIAYVRDLTTMLKKIRYLLSTASVQVQVLAKTYVPGLMTCLVLALAATFLSRTYGGPQLLYALLIGLSFHFLAAYPVMAVGINFCARSVLRLGVALLGARITAPQLVNLGLHSALIILAAVALTILLGVLLASWLDRPREEGLLSGCAVGICGASAVLAVSSVLPATKENEQFTLLAVVGVTVMSTLAMIAYPFALQPLALSDAQAGVFLGGTIHDVAQVVAAGMMMGPTTGDTATIVKLFRVMLLMPVVLVIATIYRHNPAVIVDEHANMPLVPGFLIGFLLLMIAASLGWLSPALVDGAGDLSRWLLVTAIAAVGVKTSFEQLLKLGWQPLLMLVLETAFIAVFVLAAVFYLDI